MGLNPFREQTKRTSDVVIVVVALAITVALVVWALFG
jgi:preprotein translocase subunit SecE